MRVIILGGTRFVGRAIVEGLSAAGHDLLVVHRGQHEPAQLGPVKHLHVDRNELGLIEGGLAAFGADAAVDVSATNGTQAGIALRALPDRIRLVALSSCDVYRAFESVHSGTHSDPVPLDETAPLRDRRFILSADDENLEVEERYLARGAVILRLAAVYGEHDYQHRQEFVLRRIRARRRQMPIGSGAFLFSRCYVGDVATAVRLALEHPVTSEVFNVAERSTWSIRLLAEKIIHAANAEIELIAVNASLLPEDLRITGLTGQHLLMASSKIRSQLGWEDTDPEEALRRTVAWGLANPPVGFAPDAGTLGPSGLNNFDADAAALAAAANRQL